jgi:hypothetical protein
MTKMSWMGSLGLLAYCSASSSKGVKFASQLKMFTASSTAPTRVALIIRSRSRPRMAWALMSGRFWKSNMASRRSPSTFCCSGGVMAL